MPIAQHPYLWIPGQGPDPDALRRLRARAPQPKQPMGEAWFMGEDRQMYAGLMHPDPQAWPSSELENALDALTSGPRSFGHRAEWSRWFDFLLPRVLERSDDVDFYEMLVSAVFVHCLDPALPGREPGFRRDLLDSLGRRLMAPSCWHNGQAGGSDGLLRQLGSRIHGIGADGAFSAACCLVLRYLDSDAIEDWLQSVLAIEDPDWRCAFVVWLAGAAVLVFDGEQPESMDNSPYLDIGWNRDWLLDGSVPSRRLDRDAAQFAFFPKPQIVALLASLRRHLDLNTLSRLGEQLAASPIPDRDRKTAPWQYDSAALLVAERYELQ
ncbi:hypothetical protein [Pseudomonas sp. CGJS7]|uniref:hypothetical protein n=1 Tax=Pseudomonas sp. CGJS7 TaxID=3109348 RepID=UPI003009658F